MIKKVVLIGSGVGLTVLALSAILGWSTFKSYASTARERVRKTADDAIPMDVKIESLERMTVDLDEVIKRNAKKIIEQQVDIEYMQRDIRTAEGSLASFRVELGRARSLLKQPGDSFVISQVAYTRDEVNRDALAKVDQYKTIKGTLAVRKTTMATLNEALKVSRAQLAEARSKRQEFSDRIQQLKASWIELNAKQDLAATVEGMRLTDVSNDFSEVSRRINQLQKQMRVQNDLIDRQIHLARSTSVGIDYSETPVRDARQALAEVLAPKPAIRFQQKRLSENKLPVDPALGARTIDEGKVAEVAGR